MFTSRWIKYLQDAAEVYNKRDGRLKRTEHTPDEEETVQDLPAHRDQAERAESVGGESSSSTADGDSTLVNSSEKNSDASDDDKDKRLSSDIEQQCSSTPINNGKLIAFKKKLGLWPHAKYFKLNVFLEVGGGITMKLTAEEWPLIQPSQMQTIIPPVHTAECILTLLGTHR